MADQLAAFGRTLLIAPHADDEVLGAGGTLARLADAGLSPEVAIVTTGMPPAYSAEAMAELRREAGRAHAILGLSQVHWLDLPAAALGELPHAAMNAAFGTLVRKVAPDTLLLPFAGDIHRDHQLSFLSAMVAARPHQEAYPRLILAYETLSETNWNAPHVSPAFTPSLYVDIGQTLPRKLEAMQAYASQVRPFPHERSIEALRALAMLRGATVHRHAAEAFQIIRLVV